MFSVSKALYTGIFLSLTLPALAQNQLQILKTFPVSGNGRWDYLSLCPINENLYVSHGTQVNVINRNTGAEVAVIPNTTGAHGIAFAVSFGKGYITNGKLGSVTVFDIKTNRELTQIKTGDNPDAIMFEEKTKKLIVCNGKSNSLSVIDPSTDKVTATIPVGGKPETAVSDGDKLFVNIEDKNEIVVVDLNKLTVFAHWKIGKGQEPSGLAIDHKTKRLFAGCGNELLVVINANTGKVVQEIPIGDGCDGIVFDAATKNIFSSNGAGTLSMISEKDADHFELVTNFTTQKGAKTIALDEKSHLLYLSTAALHPAAPGKRPEPVDGTFKVIVVGRK